MRLSGGVEWALHSCLVLSQAGAPVPAARLAELHGVSASYLAKNLQALSRAGIVRSTPGAVGGYELTRPPGEITALDVVLAVEGEQPAFRCTEIRQRGPLAAPPERCRKPCTIARVMHEAEAAYRRALAGVTIGDIVAESEGIGFLPAMREWLSA